MLRRSFVRLSTDFTIPSGEELDKQILMNRIRKRPGRGKYSLKALTATRLQGWVAAGGIILGAAVFLGPWLWGEIKEMIGGNFVMVDASQMPRTSPEWWENEWRKMNTLWRAGETTSDFFVAPYQYVKAQTGRDLSSARAFKASAPGASTPLHKAEASGASHEAAEEAGHHQRRSFWSSWFGRSSSATAASSLASSEEASPSLKPAVKQPPRALVPLCGDSPIVRTLAMQGYEVDAVDSSETAMRALVRRTEANLPVERFANVHLHLSDFFSSELWEKEIKGGSAGKFDVIYERQGMTSLNREQRPDYAHLLRRALKDDGVLYVEGTFRTGRVKGNKWYGPPYSLSRKDLETLFPAQDGYFVRCEEKSDAMRLLSREDKVLKRVPKSLYVTPFRCVVFKEAAVRLDNRSEQLADYDESERVEVVKNWQDAAQ